jgi:hypothetical protein
VTTLADEWAFFDRVVLASHGIAPGSVQYTEMRRPFYAGAECMFDLVTELAGPGDEPDDVGAARLELVNRELKAWAQALAEGSV